MSEQTSIPDTSPQSDRTSGGNPVLRRLTGSSVTLSLGLVLALVLLVVIGAVTAGSQFMNPQNFLTIVSYAAVTGVVSIGMTFVITAGGIDLSVGSVLGLSTVVATLASVQSLSMWWLLVLIPLVVGALAGLVNGLVIAYGRVVSFMATLAMLVAAAGLAELLSNQQTQIVQDQGFLDFFGGNLVGVPVLVWIFVLAIIVGWFLLNRTTFGRRTVAIGGNLEAARLAGVQVRRHLVSIYILSGIAAGIGGVMMLARTNTGTSTNGVNYELDAIAAVVVGGTLLIGGRGTIMGTVLGVLIFSTLTNLFTQNNLSTSVQSVAKGVIIVVAVVLQQRFASRKKVRSAG